MRRSACDPAATRACTQLDKVQQQMDDNTGWQKRVHRLSAEITSLEDQISVMKQAETDLMFRNDALKAELCGR